jgi:hypothetical protein
MQAEVNSAGSASSREQSDGQVATINFKKLQSAKGFQDVCANLLKTWKAFVALQHLSLFTSTKGGMKG